MHEDPSVVFCILLCHHDCLGDAACGALISLDVGELGVSGFVVLGPGRPIPLYHGIFLKSYLGLWYH